MQVFIATVAAVLAGSLILTLGIEGRLTLTPALWWFMIFLGPSVTAAVVVIGLPVNLALNILGMRSVLCHGGLFAVIAFVLLLALGLVSPPHSMVISGVVAGFAVGVVLRIILPPERKATAPAPSARTTAPAPDAPSSHRD